MNFFSLSFLFLGLLVLSSCTQQSKRADLVIITGGEPESLDPAIVTGQVDQNVASELFEGLVRFNKTGLSEPGIAASWEVSPDHRIYTFHLRPEAKWSNGDLITAADVVASWKRVLMPATASPNSYQLFVIEGAEEFAAGKIDFSKVGIQALDERTLKITLRHPTPYFINLCALPIFSIVPTKLINQVGENWTKPSQILTSGPFQLVGWHINDKIRLKQNPYYWDRDHVALTTIDLLPIAQANSAYNFYATGEADMIFGKIFPPALSEELKKKSDFHAACFLGTEFLRFNCAKTPFSDLRVRQAFSLCVDQEFLTRKIARAGEIPAQSLIPSGISGYHFAPSVKYNPKKARQLLAEAGYPGGKNFPLVNYLYNEGQLTEGMAVELQAIWKKELGVSVLLARQEWMVYLTSLNQLDYNIGRSSWVGDYSDPNTFLDIFTSNSGNNRTGWSSAAYDHLIEQAATVFNSQEREALFQQAEQMLVQDQAVIIPLFYYTGIQIYDPKRWGGIEGNVLDKHPLREIYKK